jgi:UDP-N-acetylglucosamine 3-dehydrogenase
MAAGFSPDRARAGAGSGARERLLRVTPSASPSPLRLGVLGCGRVFERFHLPAIDRTPGVTLAAACDAHPARLAWAARRTPRPALTAFSADLLSGPPLDAVLILTPPGSHADLTIQALEAGVAVLVEKPMAMTVEEGRRMVEAASRAGRRVQVGFARRFREPYRRLRSALDAIDRREWRAIHFELAFPTTGWNAHTTFLGDEAQGGGVLDDVLSHQVDLLRSMLGAGPDAVRAVAGGSSGGVRVELRFGELTAECLAAHGPYAERLTVELADGRRLEATGSRMNSVCTGSPTWRRRRALFLDRVALLAGRMHRRPNVSRVSFERQLQDFVQAVRGGVAVGATADDGVVVLQVLEACRESARLGRGWREVCA